MGHPDVKPGLPDIFDAEIERDGPFIDVHHLGDRTALRHAQQKMTMVRHDDESIEVERIEILNAIERFDGDACACRICENRISAICACGDQHHATVLNGIGL